MTEAYLPTNRGFHTTYGVLSGFTDYTTKLTRMNYFNQSGYMFTDNDITDYSGSDRSTEELYADRTDRIIRAHAAINRKPGGGNRPLFLYLAPQAPHFSQLYGGFSRLQVAAELVNLDRLVGRLVTILKQTGLYANTVIAFSSDNGGDTNYGGNNLPLRGQKETLWEGGLRVPAFVHSPLLPAKGVVSHQLFHITDWLPTLLRAAGAKPDLLKRQGWDGINQWDALHTPPACPGRAGPRTEAVLNLHMNWGRLEGAIREGPYKLMVDMRRRASDWIAPIPAGSLDYAYSLFDVEKDPYEQVNLAANLSVITRRMAAKVSNP